MTDTLDELRRLMAEATATRRAYREACGVGEIDDSAAALVALMNTDGPEFKAMRAATDALNRAAVNALPGLMAERDRMREALEEIARCERYLSEADTSYEYEMRQIELCRFIKTRAALGEQP